MLHLIDRRPNGRGKSAVNRERFLRRYKAQIRDRGEEDGRRAAHRRHGAGRRSARAEEGHLGAVVRLRPRRRPRVRAAGQHASTWPATAFPRPDGSGGARRRGNAGGEGDSEDDFVFSLSREEFMQIFFDDLELPNLARTEIGRTERQEERPGRILEGGRARQSRVVRTLRQSLARRIALGGGLERESRSSTRRSSSRSRSATRREAARIYAELARLRATARQAAVPRRARPALPQPACFGRSRSRAR